jgi:two-component system LytT family sensor kinase
MPKKYIGLHVLAWGLFIFVEAGLTWMVENPRFWWPIPASYLISIAFFYSILYVVERFSRPWTTHSRVFLSVLLIKLWLLYVALLLALQLSYLSFLGDEGPTLVWRILIGSAIQRSFLFSFFALCYLGLRAFLASRAERRKLKLALSNAKAQQDLAAKELHDAENARHRAQVNPHMIFNLFTLIRNEVKHIEPLRKFVTTAADFFHFSIRKSAHGGLISIKEELDQIIKLLELYQMRFNHTLQVQLQGDLLLPDILIPPAVLVTLIENVFKYGILNDPLHPATIYIYSNEQGWGINIRNKKNGLAAGSPESTKVGLENTRARLLATYGPESYALNVTDEVGWYHLELKINNV